MSQKINKTLKKLLPPFILRRLYLNGRIRHYIPKVGKISWGDLRRTSPFSTEFGYDRGGPVDRYYIEHFLGNNASHIKGRVVEIGDNSYTLAFGKEKVEKSDILHVDKTNPSATIIGDLSDLSHVPDDQFDCIILTQTLHLIYDYKATLQHCRRVLKQDGALLLTVPGITNIDQGEWGKTWFWSFTSASVERMLADAFGKENIAISQYGNILSATAFLYGMGVDEISIKEKEVMDPHYPVIIGATAIKK